MLSFALGTITIHRAPKLSQLPPTGIPADITAQWALSETLALDSGSEPKPRIYFEVPPGATQINARFEMPVGLDRRSGAPFIFDIHIQPHGHPEISAEVWRYQLHLDERDLLDYDKLPSPNVGIEGGRYYIGSSKVEILERFTITSTFPYRVKMNQPPRFFCDPHDIQCRFLLEDDTESTETQGPATQDSDRPGEPSALLAQFTFQRKREQDCDGGQRGGLITTILERPGKHTCVSGSCTFSGRTIYSEPDVFRLGFDDAGIFRELNEVVLCDFLN